MEENIPAVAIGQLFSIKEHMNALGRHPPPLTRRDSVKALPNSAHLNNVFDKWEFEAETSAGYPHVLQIEWRIGVNKPQDQPIQRGNCYYSAMAMLLYGDPQLWFWVKAQHLTFFQEVLLNISHPRYDLYTRMNARRTGPNNFGLYDRLVIPDCWINHELIQQVTADLYGIFLVVFSYTSGTAAAADRAATQEQFTDIQARGSYNSPHRFLRLADKRHYQPMIPRDFRPSKFQFPEITYQSTLGGLHMTDPDMRQEENDGIKHPWRRPLEGEAVPDKINPQPTIRIPPDAELARVLWVRFESATGSPRSARPRSLPRKSGNVQISIGGPQTNGRIDIQVHNVGRSNGLSRQIRNYYRCSQRTLERLVEQRNIEIPEAVQKIRDPTIRKDRYASYLEGWEVERSGGNPTNLESDDPAQGFNRSLSGGDSSTEASDEQEHEVEPLPYTNHITIKSVASVPTPKTPLRNVPRPPASFEDPLNLYEDIHLNSDAHLNQLLSQAYIPDSDDRETNISGYRQWLLNTANEEPGSRGETPKTNQSATFPRGNTHSGWTAVNGGVNTIINVIVNPQSGSPNQRGLPAVGTQTRLAPEPDRQSSPEPAEPGEGKHYATWSAAALRKECKDRIPPIPFPARWSALLTKRLLVPLLQARDEADREERDLGRRKKRKQGQDGELGKVARRRTEDGNGNTGDESVRGRD